MPSSVRRLVAAASAAASPSSDIGDPVWLSHEPVHDAGKGRTGSVTLAMSPNLSTEDGCSPNSPNSSASSTRLSCDDLSLEMEGANHPIRLNFGSEEKCGVAGSRLKASIFTLDPAKVNSSQEQRRYTDIWSTVKLVAEAGSGSTGASYESSATSAKKVEPPLRSEGSVAHASGQCKPCAFFHAQGCQSGASCKFCHVCPPREVQRRKRIRRRIARQAEEFNQFSDPRWTTAFSPSDASAYAAWGSTPPYASDSAALCGWGFA